MIQKIEQRFKRLTPLEHVLKRPGRYLGSIKPHTAETWIVKDHKMIRKTLTWSPALLKMFDEIISNSVDHSKRPQGKNLDTIKIAVDRGSGEISVWDNGGIPVEFHKDEKMYVPTLIFGHLLSGENFDDEADTIVTGQNGEGSSLVNIFSTQFVVDTCDGKNQFKQTWTDNMHNVTSPRIIELEHKGFTKISFIPDYVRLEIMPEATTDLEPLAIKLDSGTYEMIVKRVYDIAGCNPHLKIYLNNEPIRVKAFQDYINLYTDKSEYDSFPVPPDPQGNWQIGVARSDDGFKQVSFVNSTATTQGGTHVDHVVDQVVDKLREHFKVKYKLKDLKPNEIKQHLWIFINATIIRPRYNSQTKENLITEPKEFKVKYEVSDKLIARLLKSDIIESVLTWVEAKAKAAEIMELKRLNKDADKANPRRILKLEDASLAGKKPEECYLFICEGDSASKAIISGRDPKTMGSLALKGKPLNANSVEVKKLAENEEFFNIIAAMGLKIGQIVKARKHLRYAHLVITSDADQDGGHIAGLMVSNIHKFWPELFDLGVIHRFFTPIIRVWLKGKKEPMAFETEQDYQAWLAKPGNAESVKNFKYYKGLGTSTPEDFKGYLSDVNKHLVKIELDKATDDGKLINLVFGKEEGSTDRRKDWLAISEDPIILDS